MKKKKIPVKRNKFTASLRSSQLLKKNENGNAISVPPIILNYKLIQHKRKKLNLTAIDLCERVAEMGVNLHPNKIHLLEAGKNTGIKWTTMLCLCAGLELTVTQIIKTNPEAHIEAVENFKRDYLCL